MTSGISYDVSGAQDGDEWWGVGVCGWLFVGVVCGVWCGVWGLVWLLRDQGGLGDREGGAWP